MTEKPLHIRVAEALGTDTYECGSLDCPTGWHPCEAKRYDTDWSVTGPLIQEHEIRLGVSGDNVPAQRWWAAAGPGGPHGYGPTPLVAICDLILALKAAGARL